MNKRYTVVYHDHEGREHTRPGLHPRGMGPLIQEHGYVTFRSGGENGEVNVVDFAAERRNRRR